MEVEGPEFFIATFSCHALTYLLKLRSVQAKVQRKVTKRQPSTEGTSSNADDMPNLTHHQFEELFESAGAKLVRDMNMHRCQQNRTLIPFMLMTRTRSEGPKIAVNRWLLQMMTLMLWMRDSRGIHNESPDPHLGWLMMYKNSRPSNRGLLWECKGIQHHTHSMLQPVWKPCCQCFVYMYLCSLGRWLVYLTVINESRKMGCACEPTRNLATSFIYILFFFSGLKSVCCQLSQLLCPSFQNNTFNSCMSLIIHSRFFLSESSLYRVMCDDVRCYCSRRERLE